MRKKLKALVHLNLRISVVLLLFIIIKPDSKYRIVIPEQLRRVIGLKKGEEVALKIVASKNSKAFLLLSKANEKESDRALPISKNIKELEEDL